MKNKSLFYTLLILTAVILTSCPYSSRVPIDKPGISVNKKLFGKWIQAKDRDEDFPQFFQIEKHDKYRYKIFDWQFKTSDSAYDSTLFISYISEIEDNMFLNMQKNGEGDYLLYKIDLESNEEFTLFEVTDNIDEQFNTSEELKAFIKAYMHLSFFYNKDEKKYIRQ